MAKSYAILGIGRFGRTLAQALYDDGADVMIVDRDEEVIEQCSPKSTYAIVADLSDETEIKQLGLENIDVVIVGMGMDVAASILCVMMAKEAGVKQVIAKVSSKRMGDVLRRVGCDRAIFPEEETAMRTAQSLISSDFIDYYSISDEMCMIKMKPIEEWIGKSILQLNLKKNYHVSIAAVEVNGKFDHLIDPAMVLNADTVMLVLCDKSEVQKIL